MNNSRPRLPVLNVEQTARALTLLYGKPYEQELERVQTRIDHFRLMLEGRAASAIAQTTEKSHGVRYQK